MYSDYFRTVALLAHHGTGSHAVRLDHLGALLNKAGVPAQGAQVIVAIAFIALLCLGLKWIFSTRSN